VLEPGKNGSNLKGCFNFLSQHDLGVATTGNNIKLKEMLRPLEKEKE